MTSMFRMSPAHANVFFAVLASIGASGSGSQSCRAAAPPTPQSVRVAHSFDEGWKFFLGDPKGAEQRSFNDGTWRDLNLPHDWSIEGPFQKEPHGGKSGGYFPLGVGWYRKSFSLPDSARGQRVYIQFDGVYKNSEVWINQQSLGRRWSGYSSFQYDLTPHLRWDSPNTLTVRVDNSEQTCRWYSGSGIYRHVWLTFCNEVHFDHWGVQVTTPQVTEESAMVIVQSTLRSHADAAQRLELRTALRDPAGKEIAEATMLVDLPAQSMRKFVQRLNVARPLRWSAASTNLYTAHSSLRVPEGEPKDELDTTFGIRHVQWDSQRGLLVNGESVLLKGACIHHDLGCLGAAFNKQAMARRLATLKNIGFNAIRCSHNPPAPELLDLCDRMGFYVIDEAFDKWGGSNYATFEQDWKMDLLMMLKRDRNHPSILLWSVGNEVRQQGSAEGPEMLRRMTTLVHRVEPSRRVTCGTFPRFSPDFAKATDVASLNYSEQWYERYRGEIPDIVIVGSESYVYYRGKDDSHKAFNPVNPWFDVPRHDYVVGSFLWTGIDYLGEAVALWPCHGWNGSLVNTCGFRKPLSYLHESFWSEKPMVHLAVIDDRVAAATPTKDHWGWPKMVSHWTLPKLAGTEVTVAAMTNCSAVELFLSGRSLGVKHRKDYLDNNGVVTWRVPCEAGTLRAVGRSQKGEIVSHQLRTAERPSRIVVLPESVQLNATGVDLAHFEIRVTDRNGVVVPSASDLIAFNLQGPGKIVGVDNGDLWSDESYQGSQRKAYQGRCLVVVQTTRETGVITLSASAAGLASGSGQVVSHAPSP